MSASAPSVLPRHPVIAVAPVAADGDHVSVRADTDAILLVRNVGGGGGAFSPIRFNSAGDVASGIIKVTPGSLLDINAFNAANADRHLHLFDAIAVPANGAIPVWDPIPIARQQTIAFFWGESGLPFTVGIVAAVSTTRTTLTLAGADMWISARFI